jgi:hypothetical protein
MKFGRNPLFFFLAATCSLRVLLFLSNIFSHRSGFLHETTVPGPHLLRAHAQKKKPAPVRLLIPARRQGLSILLSMSSPPAAVHRAMAAQPSSLFSAPSPLQELGQPSSLLIAGGLLTADADSSSLDARP